jgi:hypothetical protein
MTFRWAKKASTEGITYNFKNEPFQAFDYERIVRVIPFIKIYEGRQHGDIRPKMLYYHRYREEITV